MNYKFIDNEGYSLLNCEISDPIWFFDDCKLYKLEYIDGYIVCEVVEELFEIEHGSQVSLAYDTSQEAIWGLCSNGVPLPVAKKFIGE